METLKACNEFRKLEKIGTEGPKQLHYSNVIEQLTKSNLNKKCEDTHKTEVKVNFDSNISNKPKIIFIIPHFFKVHAINSYKRKIRDVIEHMPNCSFENIPFFARKMDFEGENKRRSKTMRMTRN